MFTWAAYRINLGNGAEPLRYMFAVPNGGFRHKKTAIYLAEEGVKSGVPDIFLPYPMQGFHGLFIEMKYGRNKTTENQDDYIAYLKRAGYCVEICYSFEAAKEIILEYLGLPPDDRQVF